MIVPFGLGLGALATMLVTRGEKRMTFPTPQANDWHGWNWPVPIWNGREPVISDGFKEIKTDEHREHLGVDVMFRKIAGDPGFPYSSQHFTSQGGETPIIAAGPGVIWDAGKGRAWQLSIDHGVVSRNAGGVVTWYQHLKRFDRAWKKGDRVRAGDVLGIMGGDTKEGEYPLVHLHFEMWFPRKGLPPRMWKTNPARYMRFWRKVRIQQGVV